MQLTCPDCQVDCTFDEASAVTVTCPGCGVLLYSKSGNSGPLAAQLAHAAGKQVEVDDEDLERTRQWQKSIDDILPVPDQFPQRLGRYELRQKLGEGSFAEVYLAFDSGLSREVALKLPKRSRFSSAEQLRRFLDEGRTSAILEHPGIVRVYDIGWISDELCFISMEYCSRGSLSDRMKSESLPCDQAVELIESLAEAIHFAHIAGFIHRDLKPSNIMFGRDGRPRIVEFGLALSDAEQLNHAGEVAGTFPYMSPEQIRGDAHHLDGRTDIWSLGVIFYQLLVGRPPFSGRKSQILEQIRNRETKPLRQIKDDIPAELETICLCCLQKSPADRYYTAKDLASELRVFRERNANPLPELSKATLASPPVRKWNLQNVNLVWIALAFIFLGAFVYGGVDHYKRRIESESSIVNSLKSTPDSQRGSSLPELSTKRNPFELDSYTVPGRWSPLLEEKPKLYMITQRDTSKWSHDPLLHELLIDVPTALYLDLGETKSTRFTLEATIASRSWLGSIGLYWGGKTFPAANPTEGDQKHLHVVYLLGDEYQGKRSASFRRDRVIHTQRPKNDYVNSRSSGVSSARIPWPEMPSYRLQLQIHGDVLRVNWNDQPQEAMQRNSMPPDLPKLSSAGRFGIFADRGTFQISDVRIRLER